MTLDKNFIPDTEEWQMLCQSLSNVLLTMSGLEVDLLSEQPADWPQAAIEFAGFMVLNRERPSVFVISGTRTTIALVLAYMTGEMPDTLSDRELNDGVCELVNMVAGEVKSRLSDSARAFHLTSPIAVQGEALLFSWKTGLQIYEQYATRDDLHLKMSLFML